jgi:uncharacterized membrane protein
MPRMAKEFINPNWHVILIHYPLGVFMLGILLESLLLIFRHHGTVRLAARWMIVLGALLSLPAAFSGMYALADVARRTAPTASDTASWREVAAASSLTPEQWERIDSHVWSNGGATVIAGIVATLALACSDRMRRKLYPVFLILMWVAAAAMARGAWYGGEMVYRDGVAVKLPYREDEAAAKPTTQTVASGAAQSDSPASETQTEKPAGVDYFVNPLQAHVSLAGLAAAMTLLGIGLSLRAVSTSPHWMDPELERAGVSALPNRQRGGAEDMAVLRSFAPRVEITGEVERIPAARFWLLTFLVAATASLAGWWVLGDEHETYRPQDLWKLVTGEGYLRRLTHVIGGGAIIVLPLFMALLARIARRSRGMVALLALLLVIALAMQVWFGILLMFDQPHVAPGSGAWYRFQ